jgi:hypothetical protein
LTPLAAAGILAEATGVVCRNAGNPRHPVIDGLLFR